MCIGQEKCTELGDPSTWDLNCPLRPPGWFEDELSKFDEALDEFIRGNRNNCIGLLESVRSDEIRGWYIEHGQMSGRFRTIHFSVLPPPEISKENRDTPRSPKSYEKAVFKRDGYRCRYCGIRLVSNTGLLKLIEILDSPAFRRGPTNMVTHGIVHAFYPVADHVFPWNYGGRTSLDNLVASCASCNYGKAGFTIDQLGITDPLLRQPVVDGWNGLSKKLPT